MTELMPSGKVTAKIFPHPLNAWYAVAWDHEVTAKGLMSRTVAGKPMALYRTDRRPAGRPRRRLLAPARAALDGQAGRRRRGAVPLPRAALQLGRPVHGDARAGDGQPERDGAVVPRRRALPLPLGLAR